MALCSLGVAAGLLSVVVFARVLARFVWHRRGSGWGGGPFGMALAGASCGPDSHGDRARGRWPRRSIGRSRWLRALFHRLDTTPGQEREIRAAIEDLVDRVRDARSHARRTRDDLARAVEGDAFDDGAFEATSARADAVSAQVKDALRGALVRVHGVLDGKQRARLAAILAHGFWGARRAAPPVQAGPYRTEQASEDAPRPASAGGAAGPGDDAPT